MARPKKKVATNPPPPAEDVAPIGRRTRSGATSAAHTILPSDPLPARRKKNATIVSVKNNNLVRQLTTVADNTPVSNALPVPTTGSADNPPAPVDHQALPIHNNTVKQPTTTTVTQPPSACDRLIEENCSEEEDNNNFYSSEQERDDNKKDYDPSHDGALFSDNEEYEEYDLSSYEEEDRKLPAQSSVHSDNEYANMSELDDDDGDDNEIVKPSKKRYNAHPDAPPLPCKKTMSEEDYLLAKKERKAFFDAQRYKKMKDAKGTVSDSVSHFTGDCSSQLRPSSTVMQRRLKEQHTFPTKEILWLRIAEEANLRCIYITTYRSDDCNLVVFADNFFVGATFIRTRGWLVNVAFTRVGR